MFSRCLAYGFCDGICSCVVYYGSGGVGCKTRGHVGADAKLDLTKSLSALLFGVGLLLEANGCSLWAKVLNKHYTKVVFLQ